MHPGEGAPSFLVFALRDPMGANLDRVQIVKGWLDADGDPQEKVYDVAWSDARVARRRRQTTSGRQHCRSLDPGLDQHYRRVGTGGRLAGPGFRSHPQGILLRPRDRNPNPALDRL